MTIVLRVFLICLILTSCSNTILEIEDRDYKIVEAPQLSVIGEEQDD